MTFERQHLNLHQRLPLKSDSCPAFLLCLILGSILLFSTAGLCAAEKIIDPETEVDILWATSPQFKIDEADLKRHITFLASDSIEGRESGSRGGRAAAGYLVSELQKYGLQPAAGSNDYYQEFGSGYRNILALLPGSDPALRDQVIMIGAHYDHVGYGNSQNSLGPIGQIHNGADDNASGTSLLLELAQAFSEQNIKPKRSILFAFWDAEERGLVGSRHWIANPTIDFDRVKFYFNYDMVGRLTANSLEVYGTRTATGLQRQLVRHNHSPSFRLVYNWDNKGDSDHFPFFSKRIPYLMLHTGKHEDYHRPSDDAHKINYEGITQLTCFSARLLWEEADQAESISFRPESTSETEFIRRGIQTLNGTNPDRLGLTALPTSGNQDHIQVNQVLAGSPAAGVGLRSGDRILKFGDLPVGSLVFQSLVLKAESPVEVTYIRPPSQERKKVLIRLNGKPQLLGISLHVDKAEPGSVRITRVRPGSPAQYAGLEKNDIIWSVNDVWPLSQEEFFETLQSVPPDQKQLDLIIEREGQLQKIKVDLWPKPDSK
ncbi:MAG: M20/M25/M40 family metallo-hydrolase [Planctomycetaceae bacterium]|nr:M20/M25/M40 family metallo-hydrolase [Planctomycetaceae bacterium]